MADDNPRKTSEVDLSKVPAHVANPRTKSWKDRTEDERRAIFAAKKAAKKERAKKAREEAHAAQKKHWESLTEEERAAIKAKTAAKHDQKRKAQQELHDTCMRNMADETLPTLAFDLQFEGVMNERGVKSTISQVKYSYSIMRAAGFPVKPLIYSRVADGEGGAAPSRCLSELRAFDGFHKYPPPMVEAKWGDFAASRPVVYLSADSPTVLTDLEPGTTYMIGAFVDHNSKKGLTKAFADEHSVRTARLPIQESIDATNMCKVLTINHVVDSVVHFMKSKSWTEAFTACLPMRNVPTSERAKVGNSTADPSASGSEVDVGDDD
uniref:tRNA (guanine(9)-N(1))-methyltransferase n=1 Tax=Neobodo designis TaxID=312471 RepID=A0A7S1LF44_NEODS